MLKDLLLFLLYIAGNLYCYWRGYKSGVKSTIEEITKAVEDEHDTDKRNKGENPGL